MSFLYRLFGLYLVNLSDQLVLRFFQIVFQKGQYHFEQFVTDGFVEARWFLHNRSHVDCHEDQNYKHMGYDFMLSANLGINFSSRLIWHMYFMQDLQGIVARQKLVLHGI